jgi:hypothetical protein
VLLKTYDSTNTTLCSAVVVNQQFSAVGENADVIIDDSGIVTVVWEQTIEARIHVVLARFECTGKRIGELQLLADDRSLADQMPRIAKGKDGRFAVVWCALGAGISGQRFLNTGEKLGKVFHVSEKQSRNASFPAVKIDGNNRIGVVWQDVRDENFYIAMRVFDWQLRPSRIVQPDRAHGLAYFSNPDLLMFNDGSLVVTWKDYRTGEANIFQQMYHSTLTPIGNNILVNDDTGKQWQRLPRLAGADCPNYAVVWEDYRNDSNNQIGDIFVQRFTRRGKRIGANRKVEVASEPTSQKFPAAAMGRSGELVITWSDTRKNNSLIYLERVTPEGLQKDAEFQVFP